MLKFFSAFTGLLIFSFFMGCSPSVSIVETQKNVTFRATIPIFGDSTDAVHAANDEFAKWQNYHQNTVITSQKYGYDGEVYFLTENWEND